MKNVLLSTAIVVAGLSMSACSTVNNWTKGPYGATPSNANVCDENSASGTWGTSDPNWISAESDNYTGETTYMFGDNTYCTVSKEPWIEHPITILSHTSRIYNTQRKSFVVGVTLAADKIKNNKNAHYETVNKLTNACYAYYEEVRGEVNIHSSAISFCEAYLAGIRAFEKELINTNGDIEQAFSNATANSFFMSDDMFI